MKLLLVSWKDGKNNNDFKLKLSAPIILILNISSVAEMERNVYELESGNYDFDDSEIKQRYDNQRQLNVQLQEQKHWLEHELEEVSLTQEWKTSWKTHIHVLKKLQEKNYILGSLNLESMKTTILDRTN